MILDIFSQQIRKEKYINYMKGANIAGFMKVAKAMMAQGIL